MQLLHERDRWDSGISWGASWGHQPKELEDPGCVLLLKGCLNQAFYLWCLAGCILIGEHAYWFPGEREF